MKGNSLREQKIRRKAQKRIHIKHQSLQKGNSFFLSVFPLFHLQYIDFGMLNKEIIFKINIIATFLRKSIGQLQYSPKNKEIMESSLYLSLESNLTVNSKNYTNYKLLNKNAIPAQLQLSER